MSPNKSHLLKLLPSGSLYDFIPDLIPLTLDSGEFFIAQKGEKIATQGEDIEFFILPIDENIKLLKEENGEEKSIGFLQRKRSLALGEILFNSKYQYSAVCETPTRIIRVKKEDFLQLLKKNKKIDYYLRLIVQSSGLRSFKTFLEEKGLLKNQIVDIFNKIVLKDQIVSSKEIIELNTERLYFIKSGELEVDFVKSEVNYRKLKLFEGSFFGGESLIPPYKLSYIAKATQDTSFHFASIRDILPELEKYNVLSELQKEPWVTQRAKAKRINPWKGILTESFGDVITSQELKKLAILQIPTNLENCKSDKHSFFLNFINFCKMKGIDFNQTAILNQISSNEVISSVKLCGLFEDYPVIGHNTKITKYDLKDLQTPFLFIFNNRLNIYLKTCSDNKHAYVLDIAVGIVKIDTSLVFDTPVDTVVVNNLSKNNSKQSKTSMFITPLKESKSLFSKILILLAIVFGLNLLQPYLLQLMMDEALMLKEMDTLVSISVGLFIVLMLATLSNLLLQIFFREVTINYDSKLSSLFYKSALNKPISFFRRNNTGEILSRFYELENIRNMISIDTLQAIIDVLSILIYSLILFAYDFKLAAMPFIFLIICFVFQFFYLKRLKKNNESAFSLVSNRNSLVTEILNTITTLKFARAQKKLKARWEKSLTDFLSLKRVIQNENAFLNLVLDIGTFTIQIITIWVAVLLSIKGDLTTGAILAISIYISKATGPILSLNTFFLKTQRATLAFEKVGDVIEDELQPRDSSTNHYVNLKGKVKLERVFFRYKDKGPWNLNDINLTIHAGQCLAIVGPSGCGKTTLAKVISGLLEPNSGRVFLDDYDSEFLTKSCVHNHVIHIGQDNNLHSGSVKDNIIVDDNYINKDKFDKCISIAQAKSVVQTVEKDYANKISTGGRSLSLGERQKIAIARAIYKRPTCLVMDEMTSALDPFSEKKVFEEIRSNLLGTTQIIISHKKSAIKNADQIIVMDKGSIIETGTHEDLLKQEGLYSRLFN